MPDLIGTINEVSDDIDKFLAERNLLGEYDTNAGAIIRLIENQRVMIEIIRRLTQAMGAGSTPIPPINDASL